MVILYVRTGEPLIKGQRKAHSRTTKSGKVVRVKASTIKGGKGKPKPAIKEGYSWDAPKGKRTLLKKIVHKNENYWLVKDDWLGAGFATGVKEKGLADEIKRDKLSIDFWQKQEKAEQARKQEEEKRKDTQGFTDKFTAMKKGRVIKTLLTSMRIDGVLQTRKDFIENAVKTGRVIETKNNERRLINPKEDTLFTESDLTKTALDYFEYLKPKTN